MRNSWNYFWFTFTSSWSDRTFTIKFLLWHRYKQLSSPLYLVSFCDLTYQADDKTFNKGTLFNLAYLEILKQSSDWDCFIFHDVDLLPEDDRNLYSCPKNPRHMSVGKVNKTWHFILHIIHTCSYASAVDKFDYKLPFPKIFGGVVAFTTDQFAGINGFSNNFWGWGTEDDDLHNRVVHKGYKIERYSEEIATYVVTLNYAWFTGIQFCCVSVTQWWATTRLRKIP